MTKSDFEELDPEEVYFGKEPKRDRLEKKIKTRKDRSKFKKTDQDQLKKTKEASLEPKQNENLLLGRVLSILSSEIVVECEGKQIICTLRGSLKKGNELLKNLIAVGDFVRLHPISESEAAIVSIEPRKTVLSRADNLSRRKEQIIAANVDEVLITASVVLPPLTPAIIDRYIIASEKGGMQPIIVINKIDLLQKSENESEKELFLELKEAYDKAKIPLIAVSSYDNTGLDELKAAMIGKTSVFSGQSGVGKSLNRQAASLLPIRFIKPKRRIPYHQRPFAFG